MVYPGRRLLLMALSLSVLLTGVMVVNWLVDPYRVWRTDFLKEPCVKPEERQEARVGTPYLLRIQRPTTLLLGSSRVLLGIPIDNEIDGTFFNAAVPGPSLNEMAAMLQVALANPQLNRLIWGLDFYAFNESYEGFHDEGLFFRLQGDMGFLVKETLLSLDAFRLSRKILLRTIGGNCIARKRLPHAPWTEMSIRQSFQNPEAGRLVRADRKSIERQVSEFVPRYAGYRLSRRQVALFAEAVDRLTKRGVEVILFVGPQSQYDLESIRQTEQWETFQSWKRQLAAVGPFWDFSGYNALARSDDLYGDVFHFEPAVGHVLLRHLLGTGCNMCGELAQLVIGAGVFVTSDTLAAHLVGQEADRKARTRGEDKYSELVKHVLGRQPPFQPEPMAVLGKEGS
jgi:hypothetical protein